MLCNMFVGIHVTVNNVCNVHVLKSDSLYFFIALCGLQGLQR